MKEVKQLENDVKQLEEELSSLVDQVIALKAELESHERLIVKKDMTITELHAILVASKPNIDNFW
tara:strand:+ start:276 stop:470 length:195 start_codon:yes stop_codon:yes gene_type:complete